MDTPEQIAIAAERQREASAERLAKLHADREAELEHRDRVEGFARNPSVAAQQHNELQIALADAKTEASLVPLADVEGRLVAADAVLRAAKTALDITEVRAQAAKVRAIGNAGADSVARAKAAAKADLDWADAVGDAVGEYEAAALAADRAAIAVGKASLINGHRRAMAEARLAGRVEAENDPVRRSNPFADPIRPAITQSQFDSIRDPELKVRASREADIVPDDDPPFTKERIEAVLKARGSANRPVLTRAELAALPPEAQAKAALSSILVDG